MSLLTKAIFDATVATIAWRGFKKIDSVVNQDPQIDVVARTIWGEARNQGQAGMQAVGSVIQNRVKKSSWWGSTPEEVCKKKYQFSCWLDSDPNKAKLLAVTENDAQFKQCMNIAKQVVAGTLPDNTGGATHYHTKAINPSWAAKMTKTATIGDHIFYKES